MRGRVRLTHNLRTRNDESASVVEELEDTLGVQDVEDLRKLSEFMYEGQATIREKHARLMEKARNRGYQPSSSASSHATFGSRQSSSSGTGHGKGGKRDLKEGPLISRSSEHVALTATVLDTGLVIRFVRQKTNTMRRRTLRVVL